MDTTHSLAGKISFFTEAGKGIVRALAARFLTEGADVFGTDLNGKPSAAQRPQAHTPTTTLLVSLT